MEPSRFENRSRGVRCILKVCSTCWAKYFCLIGVVLGPILMQLDLQSVEKVPCSAFARAFTPKILETGLRRLRMSRSFLQDICRAASRFSRGPVAGNHRQHFFDSIGSNTITIPDRIEKNVFYDLMDDCNRVRPS